MIAADAGRRAASAGLASLSTATVEQFMVLARKADLTLGERGERIARRQLSKNPLADDIALHLAKSILTRSPTSLDLANALLSSLDTHHPDSIVRLLGNALLIIAPAGSSAHDIATRKIARTRGATYLTQIKTALPEEVISVAMITADRDDDGAVRRGMFRELATNPKLDQLAESLIDVAKAGFPLHGPTVNMVLMALQRKGRHGHVIKIASIMALRDLPKVVRFDLSVRHAEALIAIRQNAEAERIIRDNIKEPVRLDSWARLNSWLAARENDFARARSIFRQINSPEFRLAYVAPSGLTAVHQPEQSPGRVKIFLSAYNEAELIENLLQHYRRIAPCTFFIVDNMSEDGTNEYLSSQNDVRLWRTSDSFAKSGFGSTWINYLISTYSTSDEFILRIDADEFFVYPSMEKLSLADFFDYLRLNGFDAVHGPMVDMYPEYPMYPKVLSLSPGDQALQESRYFDSIYNEMGVSVPPYNSGWGGVRNRLFGEATFLTKSVVIRGGGEIRYYNANHYTTPASFADVTCSLLHYKFTPNAYKRYKDQIERGEHFNGGVRYRRFLKAINENLPLVHKESKIYRGPTDLVRTGFMKTSAAYEFWVQERFGGQG